MRKRDLLKVKRPRLMIPYRGNATNAPDIILTMTLEKLNENILMIIRDRNKQNPKAIWTLINDLYSRKLDKL